MGWSVGSRRPCRGLVVFGPQEGGQRPFDHYGHRQTRGPGECLQGRFGAAGQPGEKWAAEMEIGRWLESASGISCWLFFCCHDRS